MEHNFFVYKIIDIYCDRLVNLIKNSKINDTYHLLTGVDVLRRSVYNKGILNINDMILELNENIFIFIDCKHPSLVNTIHLLHQFIKEQTKIYFTTKYK